MKKREDIIQQQEDMLRAQIAKFEKDVTNSTVATYSKLSSTNDKLDVCYKNLSLLQKIKNYFIKP